jgi:hypothetical protein
LGYSGCKNAPRAIVTKPTTGHGAGEHIYSRPPPDYEQDGGFINSVIFYALLRANKISEF